MLPKISFVIPTYNESRHLPLLLSDLSSVKGFSEVIVVDSESKDKTAEIAYIYGAKIYNSKEKNRIIILSAIDNLTKGGAGQAVQNLNMIYNFKITEGLR